MSKIARYAGNLIAFAKNATGTNRTIFGSTSQSDDLTENIDNGSYPVGWEIVGPSDKPTLEDFSGAMFTTSQLAAYLHQMGVAEWSGLQEYQIGSVSNRPSGLYSCKTADHVSATPPESDATNWESTSGSDLLNTTRIDVASAATVDLTANAPDTRHINITGSNTISAFTVSSGQCYFVRFAAVVTLTNNASIVTQRSADIVTSAGDTCLIRATATNVIEVLCYTRANGAIGDDQSWINVTGSRFVNVTYTNTSGAPVMVCIYLEGNNGALDVDGVVIFPGSTEISQVKTTLSVIVPDGSTYTLTGGNQAINWAELK